MSVEGARTQVSAQNRGANLGHQAGEAVMEVEKSASDGGRWDLKRVLPKSQIAE